MGWAFSAVDIAGVGEGDDSEGDGATRAERLRFAKWGKPSGSCGVLRGAQTT